MLAILNDLAHKINGKQQQLRAAVQRHGLVLMYHRIAEPASDPWDMAVSPAHFADHLDVIRRYGQCLPLAEFAERMGSQDRPRRMIAITFDDGYRDNLLNAAPALEARDMPATVFVVSGTVSSGQDFWWDALARVFLTAPTLPESLDLVSGGVQHHWTLDNGAACSAEELRSFAGWSVKSGPSFHPRQSVFLGVWQVLSALSLADAEILCEQVLAWAGADRPGPHMDHSMSVAEVERLGQNGLIDVGGHTRTHCQLDRTDVVQATAEIVSCRLRLREMTGRDVRSFSYPFGRFAPSTPDIVRLAGFSLACTNRWRIAFPGTNRFRIPRINVANMDGEQFARFMHGIAGI